MKLSVSTVGAISSAFMSEMTQFFKRVQEAPVTFLVTKQSHLTFPFEL